MDISTHHIEIRYSFVSIQFDGENPIQRRCATVGVGENMVEAWQISVEMSQISIAVLD